MQNDRTARIITQPPARSHGNVKELVTLPATPSFSLAEANSILDIEIQADQLLAYIDKLTSLADRACNTAIRQNETTHLIEENRRSEMINLRSHLDQQGAQLHEQQLALVRLEHESKAKIATLETQLQLTKFQRNEQSELDSLRADNQSLARGLHEAQALAKQTQSRVQGDVGPLNQQVADLKLQLAKRDEMIQSKNSAIKNIELEFRAKILALEQNLRDTQAELNTHEAKLKEKDALIQATAAKEAEMGNLIKRLSSECANLSNELHEKNLRLAQAEPKQSPPIAEARIWRRVIGRLQEEPQ
jgi:chromosome segregation ATPase